MINANHICVGVIIGAHGTKGHVKLKSFTANPQDLLKYGDLTDLNGQRTFALQIINENKDFLRVQINGITTRNHAEALKGLKLFAARENLPATSKEEYYHADLIGLDVYDEKNEIIGKISAVYNFGAGDLLEISQADQQILVPFTKNNVPVIDFEQQKIMIRPMLETEARETDHEKS